MRHTCKYNIIRFRPYAETEEFANVGIVLVSTLTYELKFKLLPTNHTSRVLRFFDSLNKEVFRSSLNIIKQELKHTQEMLKKYDSSIIYDNLVYPRESIVFYSKTRAILSNDLDESLEKLYQYYVERSFIKSPGHEEVMEGEILNLLKINNLDKNFKEKSLGESYFEVQLPFVYCGEVPSAIKPIHFLHPNAKDLINHGILWIGKMQQLFRKNIIKPNDVLFAYKKPIYKEGILVDAFEDIKKQIKDAGLNLADINNHQYIESFARQKT